ncbi:MAG TPA: cache domain-containing protein, partial [Anaerolineaceae bacterium]|nr:cache domain-containing protein [Anaerolineaceae bacterium]
MVALLAGVLAGFADTHSLFTPLETAVVALLFSVAIRQRFRTRFFKFIRHPFGAGILLAICCAPLYILGAFLSTSGALEVRLDYALTQTWPLMLTRGVELIAAGIVAEGVYLLRPRHWGKIGPLQPSPVETSIQKRFLFVAIPLAVMLLLGLIVGDWIVAGNAARQMIADRISSTAKIAADSIPYLMETGQSYMRSLAQPELLNLSDAEIQQRLSDDLRSVAYFRQLYLFGESGEAITGYPYDKKEDLFLTAEEETGIQLALKGVASQTYVSAPRPEEKELQDVPQNTARISFIALIEDENGNPLGVLFGRTDMVFNPLTRPALQALQSLDELEGEGVIMDENYKIIFHTLPGLVMTDYIGDTSQIGNMVDEVSPTGTRRLAFYEEAAGKKWIVVAAIPAAHAQKMALDIAIPLLILLVVVMG